MRDPFSCPFTDSDRQAIWEMLVPRDIDAFLAADWSVVQDDFVDVGFIGIDCGRDPNPDNWSLNFASVDAYRDEWLRQARLFAQQEFAEDARSAIFATTDLSQIDISGDLALAHKKFDGGIRRKDGGFDTMNWQTLYFCRRENDRWKISGFNGYMQYRATAGGTG